MHIGVTIRRFCRFIACDCFLDIVEHAKMFLDFADIKLNRPSLAILVSFDACIARSVIGINPSVFRIFCNVGGAEIADAIIRPVTVDVVNNIGAIAMRIKEGDTVRRKHFASIGFGFYKKLSVSPVCVVVAVCAEILLSVMKHPLFGGKEAGIPIGKGEPARIRVVGIQGIDEINWREGFGSHS